MFISMAYNYFYPFTFEGISKVIMDYKNSLTILTRCF